MYDYIFEKRKLKPSCLKPYGFVQAGNLFLYKQDIMDNAFILYVFIDSNNKLTIKLIEKENNDEYVLYKTGATGAFVKVIREEIELVLKDIANKCYELSVFKTEQALMVIDFVRSYYGDELEFLWQRSPNNAIWRRKDNQKWYGAILTVSKNKLGFDTDELVEIIDLRLQPEDMEDLLLKKYYYPGWHMNKKHWYTIILDGTIKNKELFRRIQKSYNLAKK